MRNFAPSEITALAVALAVGAFTAGCGSTRTSARDHSRSAGVAAATIETTSTTTPTPTPKQAALALARGMVAEAVLPPGAAPSNAPTPPLLRGPFQTPSGGNIVGAHRAWSVADDPSAVVAFLKTHTPNGYEQSGIGTSSSPTERVQDVVDQLRSLPPNVSAAGLEIGVEADTAGTSLVNVYGGVQWTPLRPADEYVPADDLAVIVRVIRVFQPGKPVARRVVVTDPAKVTQIAQAFDALRVAPPGQVAHCYLLTSNAVSYEIAFATSSTATPDLVVTAAACSPLSVTVDGRPRPSLSASSGGLGAAVARALGKTELNFD